MTWIAAYLVIALLCAIGAFYRPNRFWRLNLAGTLVAVGMATLHAVGSL